MAAREDFDAWCQQSITDVLVTLVKHHGIDMVLARLGVDLDNVDTAKVDTKAERNKAKLALICEWVDHYEQGGAAGAQPLVRKLREVLDA